MSKFSIAINDGRRAQILVIAVTILLWTVGYPLSAANAQDKNANSAPKAATTVAIESLTAQQRLSSSPDSLIVKVQLGRVVSLGVLRKEHTARLARFANATKLGQQLATKLTVPLTGSTLVPMTLDPKGAADYQSFCKAAAASGCLYFPGPAGYWATIPGQNPNLQFIYDPLVTDASDCQSQGGIIDPAGGGGCAYGYPYTYNAQFNAGPPPPPGKPIGAGVVSTKKLCSSPITVNVDPKGAIVMQGNFAASQFNVTTNSTLTCILDVLVPTGYIPH